MTPEERAEFDDMRGAITKLMASIQNLDRNLTAKQKNLDAKQAILDAHQSQLNLLTSQANAFSLLLIAVQQTYNANPELRNLFIACLAQARRDQQSRLLFTTAPDDSGEKFDEALKRLVDPDLHSLLQ